MKRVKLMTFVLLAIMAGCKSAENSLALLRGNEWELKSMTINDTIIANPSQLPTLVFSDSSAVYGSAGCNRFFGKYAAENKGEMNIQPGGSTMMFCPDMNFEDQYLKNLTKVASYSIADNQLKLQSESGKMELVYIPVDTMKRVGGDVDAHGCDASAGYTWSEVRGTCIRTFEEGVKFAAAAGQDSTLAAYVVFSADSLKAEAFLPEQDLNPVLDRRGSAGKYAWNQEDDDTLNVRMLDGKWIIERRGNLLYKQAE